MKTNIRRIFYTLTLALCITTTAGAQSFTQHLQEKKQAKGSVTVTQSKEIEDLVNKADVSAAKQSMPTLQRLVMGHRHLIRTKLLSMSLTLPSIMTPTLPSITMPRSIMKHSLLRRSMSRRSPKRRPRSLT